MGPSALECSLSYPAVQAPADGPLFKANEMEDKWDIYFFNPHLYFARSWGGQLIYRATVDFEHKTEHETMMITRIEFAADHDAEFSRRSVDYLIKSHLLGAVTPHPIPRDVSAEPARIAAFSFSTFGRRCACGTYADTTVIP